MIKFAAVHGLTQIPVIIAYGKHGDEYESDISVNLAIKLKFI